MSFIPPFSSDDLSEPTDTFEPLEKSKSFSWQKVTHRILSPLQLTGLYQRVVQLTPRSHSVHVAIRSHFDTRLQQNWENLGQERQPLSLFLCEIDDLHRLRKQYGDLACNAFVGQVNKVIHTNIDRSKDLLARYQGDTLAVLVPYTSIDEAACIAKKIRLRVKALKETPLPNHPIPEQPITLSLGIATLVPTPKLTPANLIAAAEQSLRQAQRAGGNRIILQEGTR